MSTNLNYHPRRLIIVMNSILYGFESAKHFPNCLNDTCKFFANFSVKFAGMKNNLYLT